jgi:GTPase
MQIAPPEIEEGNIEYKRHFINVSNSRLHQLTAQMNWRINEGNGLCYYYLGICDNGTIYENFSQEDIDYSLDIIKLMCDGCNAYIDNIIIHRSIHIWLNVIIKKKNEYINEYRILCNSTNINKLIKQNNEYKKSKDIFFNTIIHNNEKYLFFECKKPTIDITNMIDFNLIINNNFDNMDDLFNYIDKNMIGNNINNNDNVIFNIIKYNYIQSIGYIISGFLKQGIIKKNMILNWNKNKSIIKIISIHNNYIDCSEVIAPATISIRIVLINNNNINNLLFDGYFYSIINNDHNDQVLGQNEQVQLCPLDLQQRRQDRRDKRRGRKELVLQEQLFHLCQPY